MNFSASSSRLWLLAIRPKTLPAAVAPVLVGGAVALDQGAFQLWTLFVCLLFALIMQIGANLANDYFDWKRGIDSGERLGPKRFCQSGLIAPQRMRRAMLLCFSVAALLLPMLIVQGGWPVIAMGLVAITAALAYSGGPYPLASHALGELAAFVFFGLMAVGGSALIISGHYSGLAFIAAIPPGLLIAAIMLVNNVRDRETDAAIGKRTLAVVLGRRKSIALYRALLLCAFVTPLAMSIERGPFLCLPLLCLPSAWRLWRDIETWRGARLNELLAATALLTLAHSLFLAVGIILSRMTGPGQLASY
ncbi:MAG: 1,4-dihydroxy-2-naphthoate polyprenyltransferase [Desulfobulbaceae bacterium]|jgi:1,4-dihydroxy-2-naphthoate octaprenyltransferase|nr:1,4-dihydroxy-2-naphthoate polyprenyltransferase [Desulfobulbaceae bacterium]